MATDLVQAPDGYCARPLTGWAHEKLFYIKSYLDIFCTAMENKWTLVYADLLAGPGVCVDPRTKKCQLGSALLALNRTEFTRLYFNDIEPTVTDALKFRSRNEETGRVLITTKDCNVAVSNARRFLFPSTEAENTLGLAVIDPTAFQMSFEAISRLTSGLRLDLIIIYMTGYLKRFIDQPGFKNTLDEFYGTRDWRDLVTAKDIGERVTSRKLLDLYERRLESLGYSHVDDKSRMINSKRSTIYHIIFASRHPRGADFFEKISKRSYSGQRRLF